MPETTTAPTASEVAEAMAWFREDPDITLEQLAWGDAPAAVYAATLVRAALAAAPAVPDDAHTETVTEYRVTGFNTDGRWMERKLRSFADADYVSLVVKRDGWTQVEVESRTVTTSRRESEWKATDQ